jgi:hypothetical protein
MSAKEKYFTTDFIHSMSDSIYLYQSVSLSPSFSLSFHDVSVSLSSVALGMQHFVQHFTVTSGEMHCNALLSTSNNTFIFVGLCTYLNT